MQSYKKPKAARAKDNEQLAHDIVEKFTTALAWREPFKNKWDRFYKLYRSDLEETNYPWQSNLFIPYSFSTVETLVPRLVSNRPEIDIMPREQADEDHAKVMKSLIDYQWDIMDMNTIIPDAVKEMAIYGTCILKVSWKTVSKQVIRNEQADENLPEAGSIETKKEETLYDAPSVELVDLYDFYWDPNGTDIDTCKWVFHRSMRHKDHIKDLAKQGIYKNVNLVLQEDGFSITDDDQKSMRRATIGISLPPDDSDMVELLEYWEDGKVCTIANRKYVIREEENPYRHGKKIFVRCVDQKVPHEFCGIGELEPIESLQYELNDRRNQRMDNVTLALNRMWAVQNGQGVDEDELVSDAGGVVHMNTPGAVQPLDFPDVTSSSYQEETLIKGDIQQTSGISDYTQGVGNSGSLANDTATGISLIQEAGNSRFRLKAQNIEDMLIKRLGELMVSMNEQFITEPQVLRIAGDDGVSFQTVAPDEIAGNFDVQVVAGSTLPNNEAVNNKQVMEMFQLFQGNPAVDQKELIKMVLKSINPKVNLEKLVPAPDKTALAGVSGLPGTGGEQQVAGNAPQGQPTQQSINQSALSA